MNMLKMRPTKTSSVKSMRIPFIVCFTILYYPLSVGLTFYQKWFIKGYKFPLLVIFLHYICKFAFAALIRRCYMISTGKKRTRIQFYECVRYIAPVGLPASIDIGLSNWSLEYITVSLYTMAKCSSIVFIYLFSLALSLEKLRFSLVWVIVLISTGLFMFTYKSEQFNLLGFLLVELAALCAGIRWAFSQFVMHREEMGLDNALDIIFHVQPWMIVSIVPLVLIFEGDMILTDSIFTYSQHIAPMTILLGILIGGCIAFCMELAEYSLLYHTSCLTLSIFGILKEIVILILAYYFEGDMLTHLNLVGLLCCFLGITLHIVIKVRAIRVNELKSEEISMSHALLSDSDSE